MRIYFGCGLLLFVAVSPVEAQDLSGAWQGVEISLPKPGYWPSLLTLENGTGTALTGTLYQEDGNTPSFTILFQIQGNRTATGARVDEARIISQQIAPGSHWCQGVVVFTYDAALEKLSGSNRYRTEGNCDRGTFELYRIKLKSAATVQKNTISTLRVSGQNVRWFADAALTRPLATGNTYRAKLDKTTTFYLTQGFYSTKRSPVVPVRVQVTPANRPIAVIPVPTPAPAPVVLPSVLFRQGTAELLPAAGPALDQLAATLRARPALRLQVAGHTDRLGESGKNQQLSEQRAAAVQRYLIQKGVAADRLTAVGYGDSRPLYPAPDDRNRRVEITEIR